MNVEHQSVLTYKDRIDAQLLLMLSGPLMELDRTREMSQQQKVIFKNKFIISNRKGIKAREIRIFRYPNLVCVESTLWTKLVVRESLV